VRISIPYGDGNLPLDVPDANLLAVVQPGLSGGETRPPTEAEESAEVRRALAEPIGAPRLRELAATARSAVIVVSDITRPSPSHKLLPALLEELARMKPEDISILFALGGHRGHSSEERVRLVGEEVAASGVRLLDLDGSRCRPVGVTSRGTRLEVFEPYLEADLRICTGNIEYHYFAGFSGGAKAIVPGLCSSSTIRDNHSMMLAPTAKAGIIQGNPVREDIDEAGGMIGVDFILNVVLDERKRILRAVAGHYLAAHREGARIYDARFSATIDGEADVVIASPGGRPKDINLYQAQKTLDNVGGAVRKGGAVILAARCDEGFGQRAFEDWMLGMATPQALVDRIQREFVLGGHKAAAIAGLLNRAEVFLVSELPDDAVRKMYMHPFNDLQDAVDAAFARYGKRARVLVVPHGNRVEACPVEMSA
jgi:nickel-dependent lactate racemase